MDRCAAWTALLCVWIVTVQPSIAGAESTDASPDGDTKTASDARWPRLASGPLQDNSFLIEEAYNQEAGVVQHILTTARSEPSGRWDTVFTQEWPVPDETHQLSFTVPYTSSAPSGERDGVGDVLLNYRYQLLREDAQRPAIAPRLSLVLPTGSVDAGRGDGSVGVQLLAPASKQWNDYVATHLNAGMSVLPRARAVHPSDHQTLLSWLAGGSVIWEPWDAVNFLTEIVVADAPKIVRHHVSDGVHVVLDPGIRVAWNGPWTFQWVAGIGVPIELTDDHDVAVLFYLSAEHAFTTAAAHDRDW